MRERERKGEGCLGGVCSMSLCSIWQAAPINRLKSAYQPLLGPSGTNSAAPLPPTECSNDALSRAREPVVPPAARALDRRTSALQNVASVDSALRAILIKAGDRLYEMNESCHSSSVKWWK